MRHLTLSALLASIALGCGPAAHTRATGAVSPLAVRAVTWNPAKAPLGRVSAVAESGDVVAVFSDRGATVLSARAPVATDASLKDCVGASALAGADGASSWILGVGADGHVYHLRGLSSFEDVTDRYGLGSARVLGAASLGGRYSGFLLAGQIAIADGTHVTRYASAGGTFEELAGGALFGVLVQPTGVQVFDVTHGALTDYALPGVTHAAVGANGRLYATTRRAVYVGDAGGRLSLVFDATNETIHGLVASGSQVWFADGDELGVVDDDHVAETSGAKIARDAKLSASPSGDVWVLSGGALDRFARAENAATTDAAWTSAISPIFARSCSSCHRPGGVSGTDLSTAQAWEGERAEIRQRVVERKSMPPQGHPLSDEDRGAIQRWVEGAPSPDPALTHL